MRALPRDPSSSEEPESRPRHRMVPGHHDGMAEERLAGGNMTEGWRAWLSFIEGHTTDHPSQTPGERLRGGRAEVAWEDVTSLFVAALLAPYSP